MLTPNGLPLKVLVVDDHADTAALTSRILSSAGHVVWTAATCGEALEIAKANSVDVLVSDIGLPDGDGCDLLQSLLAIYPVHAIAFTGHVFKLDKEKYQKAGFKHFVAKPATMEDLQSAVATFQRP